MKNSYDMEFDKIHVPVMSYDTKKTWLMIQIKLWTQILSHNKIRKMKYA